MRRCTGIIFSNSTWITHTPTLAAKSLPFTLSESGHFYVSNNYSVCRDFHDSFLIIYTLKGSGKIQSAETIVNSEVNNAVIIDCHKFHQYYSTSPIWEFVWFHIKGCGTEAMFKTIYPEQVSAISISNPEPLFSLEEFSAQNEQTDIVTAVTFSSMLHILLNSLVENRLNCESNDNHGGYADLVNTAITLIKEKYSAPLSIDEITKNIPVSKYHFIRIFKKIMGVTPYHYLTVYRINMAKILLRSENIPVNEVAERCGFADTSNFIYQFKKHTGQKPLEYKKYFR